MCGIAGIYAFDGRAADTELLQRMTQSIRHRGPDDEGYLQVLRSTGKAVSSAGIETIPRLRSVLPSFPVQEATQVAFGFRRLMILDLSPAGHQPMSLADGSCHIVYNGEVYNYLELRAELESLGYVFHTQTDTEVILNAYHRWGTACLQKFTGMWAFAIWDAREKRLFCSRDRYGIKPFYYAQQKGCFYFSSEIKQLLCTPVDKALNYPMVWRSNKINALLAYGEETYFTNIKALRAGHYLIVKGSSIESSCYDEWQAESFEKSPLKFEEAVEQYRAIFMDSVKLQMRSDVEVGSCLSGGMDSSAIVCTAAKLTDKPLKTFSSYYPEDAALDERKWIKLVSESAGVISHLVSPSAEKTVEWFEKATWFNDLPVGSGFVSQYAVMELAKEQGMKVLLDGQGSDELTAGYNHSFYRYFADLLRRGKLLRFDTQLHRYSKGKPLHVVFSSLGKILLSVLHSENYLYNLELKHYRFEPFSGDFLKAIRMEGENPLAEIVNLPTGRLSNFLCNLVRTTSIPTLLHYEDRLAMAHSIESRVPFLDHRLVRLTFSLPSSFKINPPLGKYVHREAMKGIIPKEIYKRRDKAIFGSPFYSLWLRNDLKEYINDIFSSREFRSRSIWNLPLIEKKWDNFKQKGSKADGEMLYNLLALENWFRLFSK